jgi:phytoene synthase
VNAIDSEPVLEARARASGSSFYLAMRLMPREQRQAMFEIYAFCRAVDDIADNGGPRDVRLAQLQRWRRDVDAIYAGAAPPRLRALAEATQTFDLRRDDFLTVIDGMEMDVIAPICAPDWATLDLYCDRVASAVGRLCVRVFKMDDAQGVALAHHLGRALQLTNILRDIDEDAGIGRLYLPQEALSAAGIASTEPLEAIADPAIDRACAPVVARAQRHFAESDAIIARSPRRVVRTPRVMSAAYRSILERLVVRGWLPPRAPVKRRRAQLIWIVLCHGIV